MFISGIKPNTAHKAASTVATLKEIMSEEQVMLELPRSGKSAMLPKEGLTVA